MKIPTHVNKQLPPPSNWQDFERLSRDLWAAIWRDDTTELNGRGGQKQHGVDVFGRKGREWHGVQCKGKDSRYGGQVTETELRSEVEKAKSFRPLLTSFTIATTGQDDAVIQAIARDITAAHMEQGLFSVHVICWGQIENYLGSYDHVLEKYYEGMSHSVGHTKRSLDAIADNLAKGVERDETRAIEQLHAINALRVDLMAKFDQTAPSQPSRDISVNSASDDEDTSVDTEISRKLDVYRDLIATSPKTALDKLRAIYEQYWAELGPHTRFRLLTNIGACDMERSNFIEAGEHFREAFELGEEDQERATRNMAVAHLIANEFVDAKSMAEKAIAMNPNEADSYSILVAAAVRTGDTTVPEALVPIEIRKVSSVCFSLSRVYDYLGESEQSISWIREGLRIKPEDNTLRTSLGTALIGRALEGRLAPVPSTMTKSAIADLQEGINLIAATWSDVRASELAPSYAWSVVNLCAALSALGRSDEVPTYIHQIEAAGFDKPELRKVAVTVAMDQNDFKAAESLLRAVPVDSKDAELDLMHAQCLAALERFDDALDAIDSAIAKTDDEQSIVAALGFKIRIIGQSRGVDAALLEADQALVRYANDATLLANLSEFHRRHGNQESAIEFALRAAKFCDETSETVTRLAVADALFDLRRWIDALPLYRGLVRNYSNSPQIRRLLICQLNADQRKAAFEILEKMDPETMEDDFFLRIRTSLYVRSGDLIHAVKDVERLLGRDPNDLEMRICWLGLQERLGKMEVVKSYLQSAEVPAGDDPTQLLYFAQWLARFGFYQVALDTAYRARREHNEKSKAHLLYMGLFFQIIFPNDMLQRNVVSRDCAFRIRRENGEQKSYIIDDGWNNNVFPGEIGLDHPIAQYAIGKRVGDCFELSSNPYQSHSY